jgi:hypothetical protein
MERTSVLVRSLCSPAAPQPHHYHVTAYAAPCLSTLESISPPTRIPHVTSNDVCLVECIVELKIHPVYIPNKQHHQPVNHGLPLVKIVSHFDVSCRGRVGKWFRSGLLPHKSTDCLYWHISVASLRMPWTRCDIEYALSMFKNIARSTPDSTPNKPLILNNLATH